MAPVNIADQTVAEVAVGHMINEIRKRPEYSDGNWSPADFAEDLLKLASKVRFQPSTRQLVLTFDLAFNTSEPEIRDPVAGRDYSSGLVP